MGCHSRHPVAAGSSVQHPAAAAAESLILLLPQHPVPAFCIPPVLCCRHMAVKEQGSSQPPHTATKRRGGGANSYSTPTSTHLGLKLDLGGLEGVVRGEVDGHKEHAARVWAVPGPHDRRLQRGEVAEGGGMVAGSGGEWWRAAAAEAAAGFCCACRSGHLAACYAACEGAWHSLRRRGGHQAVRQGRGADLPVKQVISCRPRTARSGRVLLQVLQGGTESGGR